MEVSRSDDYSDGEEGGEIVDSASAMQYCQVLSEMRRMFRNEQSDDKVEVKKEVDEDDWEEGGYHSMVTTSSDSSSLDGALSPSHTSAVTNIRTFPCQATNPSVSKELTHSLSSCPLLLLPDHLLLRLVALLPCGDLVRLSITSR